MSGLRHLRGMKRGNYRYDMPEDERPAIREPDFSDDEDGYAWDPDLGGDLGNYDDDEGDED